MARKTFATPIEEDILKSFKNSCKSEELRMNEVIEVLMKEFSDGKISIKVKKNYIVNKSFKANNRATNVKQKGNNSMLES